MQFQHGTVPQQPLLRLSKRPRAGIVRCHVRCHVRCRQHRTCALISCSLCCCRRGIPTPNSPQPQASTISRHKIRIRTGSSIYAQYFQFTKLSRRPRRSARASFKLTGSKHTKGKAANTATASRFYCNISRLTRPRWRWRPRKQRGDAVMDAPVHLCCCWTADAR